MLTTKMRLSLHLYSILNVVSLAMWAHVVCCGADVSTPPLVYVDRGGNASLPCPWAAAANTSLVWVRDGRALQDATPTADGRLLVHDATDADEGLYGCQPDGEQHEPRYVRLLVGRLPDALASVTVHAHTVLAEVFWRLNDTLAASLMRVMLRYRAVGTDDWKTPLRPHMAPSETHCEVYHLRPNITYVFEMWTENRLGAGPVTTVYATTRPDPASQTDLTRGLLAEAVVLGSESWVASVSVSLVAAALVLVAGACLVCRSRRDAPANADTSESLELVSHLQQPGYELEVLEPDDAGGGGHSALLLNNNSRRALLLNNNVEVHPVRI